MSNQRTIIPVYTSRGDAEAFLAYPYLFNRLGEWIGFVTRERQVFSVLGIYVGDLTSEPRIIRRRVTNTLRPRTNPPPPPSKQLIPGNIPLAPMMPDLRFGYMDVLLEEPELLHTMDAGELRQDLD